jgi:hypothetical protein
MRLSLLALSAVMSYLMLPIDQRPAINLDNGTGLINGSSGSLAGGGGG